MAEELEVPECDCCGYPAPLKEYSGQVTQGNLGGEGKSKFCDICASTFLSHWVTYPDLYGQEHHLWSSIGWIANRILDEIRTMKEQSHAVQK